jgi:4-carboxymuconolactone decarboxylase
MAPVQWERWPTSPSPKRKAAFGNLANKVSDQEYQAALAARALGCPRKISLAVSGETLSARQQAIPIDGSFHGYQRHAASQCRLEPGLDAGITISEAKEVLVQLYAYAGFPEASTRSASC